MPLASASTTDSPNGSSKLMRWSSARAEPSDFRALRAAHRAAIDDAMRHRCAGAIVLVVIVLILDDAGHDQPPARPARRRNRLGRPLVGVDAAEEEQIVAAVWVEAESPPADAVVDGRRIAQVRMAVGVADRDVVNAIVRIALKTGRMRSEEKPWIVVTTGVSTSREKASGTKSAWLWIRSNSPARSKTWATWSISHTLASMVGSSE